MKILFGYILLLISILLPAAPPLAIPRIVDPPPELDGNGLRMMQLPGMHAFAAPGAVIWSAKDTRLGGAEDCSANVVFGYDAANFYLFATVRDDCFTQSHSGENLFRGDHIMLIFDLPAQQNSPPDAARLFKLVLSPGNFAELRPEAKLFSPLGCTAEGVRLAAKRTTAGYQLEAAIPWNLFGVEQARENLRFRFDCLIGDSDDIRGQKSLLALSGGNGFKDPVQLPFAITVGAEGVLPDATSSTVEGVALTAVPLAIARGQETAVAIPDAVAESLTELIIHAVLEQPKYGGGTHAMRLEFNGTALTASRSLNRGETVAFSNHYIESCGSNDRWYTFYGPLSDLSGYPEVFSDGGKIIPIEFRLAVGDLIRSTGNVLTLSNAVAPNKQGKEYLLQVTVAASSRPVDNPATALNAELAEFIPQTPLRQPQYQATLAPDGAITVTLEPRTWKIVSEYSTLTPGWAFFGQSAGNEFTSFTISGDTAAAQTHDFSVTRRIVRHPNKLTVIDTVKNLTGQSLPLIYRHRTDLGGGVEKYMVGGQPIIGRGSPSGPVFRADEGDVPTVLALYADRGLGLVREDDSSRAIGFSEIKDHQAVVGNDRLVLKPGEERALEFSVYPLETPDHFIFVNRIREDWNTNFPIAGSGAFMMSPYNLQKGADYVCRQARAKSIRYALVGFGYFPGTAIACHGNGIFDTDTTVHRQNAELLKQSIPGTIALMYYHCFISNGKDDIKTFAEDRMLRPDGSQAVYSQPEYPMFTPRPGSKFARRSEEIINLRFDLGYDGIYWDEFDYTAAKFDYNAANWDGDCAEIDPQTHRIVRKMNSLALSTQPWRQSMLEKILARSRDGAFVANGAPATHTMTQYHFPRFIETGHISNLRHGQLYTPIALGDHLTERNEVHCYRNMTKALDYGSLYYWYHYTVPATHPTLTDAMYPITPLTLGRGHIIGQERILTNHSGYFGWNDRSGFTARVFNAVGVEVPDFKIPQIDRNGKTFAEVRLPRGYSAALIRQLQ